MPGAILGGVIVGLAVSEAGFRASERVLLTAQGRALLHARMVERMVAIACAADIGPDRFDVIGALICLVGVGVVEGGAAVKVDQMQMLMATTSEVALEARNPVAQVIQTVEREVTVSTAHLRARKVAEARIKGYEGDACGNCGNFTLVRNGTCLKCDTCGSTSGCSSRASAGSSRSAGPGSSR